MKRVTSCRSFCNRRHRLPELITDTRTLAKRRDKLFSFQTCLLETRILNVPAHQSLVYAKRHTPTTVLERGSMMSNAKLLEYSMPSPPSPPPLPSPSSSSTFCQTLLNKILPISFQLPSHLILCRNVCLQL